ncbi:MAG: hypothetical protein JWN40_2454 [Phycisphaerales bacterium]|nr:hypothetical protein [Phycisphaerales bacterium]
MEDLNHDVADDDLSRCCQNRRCVAFGTYGGGNLMVRERIGKRKHIRLLVLADAITDAKVAGAACAKGNATAVLAAKQA